MSLFATDRYVESAIWTLVAEGSLVGYAREVLDQTAQLASQALWHSLSQMPAQEVVRALASWHVPVTVGSVIRPYEAIQEGADLLRALRLGERVQPKYEGLIAMSIQQLRLSHLTYRDFVLAREV